MSRALSIELHARTHLGLVRSNNEDSIGWNGWMASNQEKASSHARFSLSKERVVLGVIADGMGGHRAGEVASHMVVESLSEPGWLEAAGGSAWSWPESVVERIQSVHKAIDQRSINDLSLFGMGSTVAGLVFQPGSAGFFNVGDSRVYLLRGTELRQLSTDDCVGPGKSHVLTQALGGSRLPDVHYGQLEVSFGDRFMICSDGLSDCVADEHIAERLQQGEEGIQALLSQALEAGGRDNISVLMASLT